MAEGVQVRRVDPTTGRNLGEFAPPVPRPNAIDRVVGFFSPRAGLERVRARMGLDFMASYTGARTDRPSLRHWTPRAASADTDAIPDLPALRARSRDAERNEPIGTAAINVSVTEVVGTGLVPRSQVDREYLGLTEEEAVAWQAEADRIWWWFWDHCDITRKQDFGQMQGLAFRSTFASGDVFALRRFRQRPGDLLGLKVQLVEADRVCNPNYLPDSETRRAGIDFDADGAPIRFHVAQHHPGEMWRFRGVDRWTSIPAFGRQGDPLVLHLFERKRPGQSRGVPFLAPVLEPLRELGRWSEAELTGALTSALFTAFIKTEQLGEGASLAPLQQVADDPDATAQDKKRGEVSLGSGAIVDLAPGEDVVFADPSRPNAQFDPFFVAVVKQIGAALEIPFEILLHHFAASYSASRAVFLQAWKFFRARREWLTWDFCQPVREWVITEAISRGLLRAPGYFTDPLARQAWLQAEWTGPAMGQVDPVKEVEAWERMEDRGWATATEATAALTGGDWEMKHQQRVREQRLREEAGFLPPKSAAAPPQPTRSDEQDREEAA